MKSTLGAGAIVAAVITTFTFATFVPSDLQRQTALLRQFPELGFRSRRTERFIVDPLLRKARSDGSEAAYDRALNALVEARSVSRERRRHASLWSGVSATTIGRSWRRRHAPWRRHGATSKPRTPPPPH